MDGPPDSEGDPQSDIVPPEIPIHPVLDVPFPGSLNRFFPISSTFDYRRKTFRDERDECFRVLRIPSLYEELDLHTESLGRTLPS